MKLLSLMLSLFCLAGCGYHFSGQGGTLPGGVEKIYIPLFINKTAQPQLENKLTNQVSEVFSRNKKITQVESQEAAEAVFDGTIRSYSRRALSYDKNDDISEYRAKITVDARLQQTGTGQQLWQGTVSWSADYNAADDKAVQADLEQQAIDEIALRLAEELLYQLVDDF